MRTTKGSISTPKGTIHVAINGDRMLIDAPDGMSLTEAMTYIQPGIDYANRMSGLDLQFKPEARA